MDPKERLEKCEAKIIEHALNKLEQLASDCENEKWFKRCQLRHLEEQTKLAHRVRSLINKESAPVVK